MANKLALFTLFMLAASVAVEARAPLMEPSCGKPCVLGLNTCQKDGCGRCVPVLGGVGFCVKKSLADEEMAFVDVE